MSVLPSTDSRGVPVVRTAIGHFFIPTAPPEVPRGVDAFVPAIARDPEVEILGVAAFVALWSLAAAGCFLPWVGLGGIGTLQNLACLLVWIPLWFLSLVLCVIVPGAFIYPLLRRDIVNAVLARSLCVALTCLVFSLIALILARSPLPFVRGIGWTWLGALGIEVLLRFVLLFAKIRR